MFKTPLVATTLFALSLAAAMPVAMPANAQTYHVAQTYKLGITGGFDYLTFDQTTHMLYVAQGPQVVVFNPATGTITGTLSGLTRTHGVVMGTDGVTAYVSDGGANQVVIFNRKTMANLGAIKTGMNPDGMILEPVTGHLISFNGRSKDASVMDLTTKTVIATIPLPGKPEFPTVDGKGNIFVNIEDKNEVVKITAADNKAVAIWPLAGCDSPSGMAIDVAASRIFSVCDKGKMVIVDTTSGKVVATPSIGDGPDAAGYDPGTHLVFSSNGGDGGTLSIIQQKSPDSYNTIQTLKTTPRARTMALDTATGDVYTMAPEPGSTGQAAPLILLKLSK